MPLLARREPSLAAAAKTAIIGALQPSFRPMRTNMAKKSYQQRIIHNYYENRGRHHAATPGRPGDRPDPAEGQTRARLWNSVGVALEKLKLPRNRIQHVVGSDNPALPAEVLKELLENQP